MTKTISMEDIKRIVAEASDYRINSPVFVDGQETYVTSIPDGKGVIDGYTVSSDTFCHSREELEPVPLKENFFLRHNSIFKKEGALYTCRGNSHVLSVTKDNICIVDAKEFGHVHKHELLYIMKELCNISIPTPDNS